MKLFDKLISNLKTIDEKYNDANNIANEIFNTLKIKKLKNLPELTNRQVENVIQLKKDKEILRKVVIDIAISHNIEGERIQHILPLFPQLEKEKIIDLQREIIKKEEESNRALFRNQEFLSVLMSTTEALVDAAIYLNEQNSKDNHMFFDKKF